MTRFANQSAAAVAALLIAVVSMNAVISVPPAQAQENIAITAAPELA